MTDISKEAVERHLNLDQNHESGLIPCATHILLRALRAELDRSEARVAELERQCDELDFLRHEGGPQSVAAMEACLRDVVLPILRSTAEDLFRCVSVRLDPDSVSPSDWRDIAPDMESVLTVEAFVGRPDDDYGSRLNPILDAAPWRHHNA